MNIQNLKKARTALKLSQKELANTLGISNVRYNQYETGKRTPDYEMLSDIAKTLGVDVSYLLGATNTPNQDPSSKENQLILEKTIEERIKKAIADMSIKEFLKTKDIHPAYAKVIQDIINLSKSHDSQDVEIGVILSISDMKSKLNIVSINDLKKNDPSPNDEVEMSTALNRASAGSGLMLQEDGFEKMRFPRSEVPRKADFGVYISGDSMMPDYCDGDLVWIEKTPNVAIGEVGLFSLNEEGFIKKLGKDCLISLNPDYEPIAVSEYDFLHTFGRVIGKTSYKG